MMHLLNKLDIEVWLLVIYIMSTLILLVITTPFIAIVNVFVSGVSLIGFSIYLDSKRSKGVN